MAEISSTKPLTPNGTANSGEKTATNDRGTRPSSPTLGDDDDGSNSPLSSSGTTEALPALSLIPVAKSLYTEKELRPLAQNDRNGVTFLHVVHILEHVLSRLDKNWITYSLTGIMAEFLLKHPDLTLDARLAMPAFDTCIAVDATAEGLVKVFQQDPRYGISSHSYRAFLNLTESIKSGPMTNHITRVYCPKVTAITSNDEVARAFVMLTDANRPNIKPLTVQIDLVSKGESKPNMPVVLFLTTTGCRHS